MKQAIIVLAVLSFTIIGISQTPNDKGAAVDKRARRAGIPTNAEKEQKHAASPPSGAITIYNQNSAPERNSGADQHKDDVEIQRKLVDYTAALVGVGILQFLALIVQAIVFYCTLRTMNHHSEHLGKIAEAARLNARAVINAERPWFLVNIKSKQGAPGQYIVGAFNAGRTPAIVNDGDCSCDKHSANFLPPEDLNDPFEPKRDLIVSEDSFPIRVINPESLINQVDREGVGVDPQILFVYGQLRYWDTFTDRNSPAAKPYETWWCFHYDPTNMTFLGCANGYARNT